MLAPRCTAGKRALCCGGKPCLFCYSEGGELLPVSRRFFFQFLVFGLQEGSGAFQYPP